MPPRPIRRTIWYGPTVAGGGESGRDDDSSTEGSRRGRSRNPGSSWSWARRRSTSRRRPWSPAHSATSQAARSAGPALEGVGAESLDLLPACGIHRRVGHRWWIGGEPASGWTRAEFGAQPRSRDGPRTADRPLGRAQDLGDLGIGQPAEEAILDDSRSLRIEACQPLHRLIQRHQFIRLGVGHPRVSRDEFLHRVQWHVGRTAPALLGVVLLGVVDQDAPHGLGGQRKEVLTAVPRRRVLVGQSEPSLVHQCRGVEGVAVPLTPEAGTGEPVQLRIDHRKEAMERTRVADRRLVEEAGDFTGTWIGGGIVHGHLLHAERADQRTYRPDRDVANGGGGRARAGSSLSRRREQPHRPGGFHAAHAARLLPPTRAGSARGPHACRVRTVDRLRG